MQISSWDEQVFCKLCWWQNKTKAMLLMLVLWWQKMIRPNFWPFVKEFSLSHNFSTPPTTSGGGDRWVIIIVSKSDVTKFFPILDQSKKTFFPLIFFGTSPTSSEGGGGQRGSWCQKRNPTNFIAISDHSRKRILDWLYFALFGCIWWYLVVFQVQKAPYEGRSCDEAGDILDLLYFIVSGFIWFHSLLFGFIWLYLVVFGCIWWYLVVFQVQIAPYEGKRCDEGWYLGLRGLRKFARFSPQVGHLYKWSNIPGSHCQFYQEVVITQLWSGVQVGYKWSNIPGSHCQFYQEVMITQLWIGPQERWGLVWLSRGKNLQFLCCVPTKEQTDRRRSYQAGILE